jgi:hypothetical protein
MQLEQVSFEDFISEIAACLNFRGDSGAGIFPSEKQAIELKQLQISFIQKLAETFPASECEFILHPPISNWVHWQFCFLIVSNEENRTFLFEGSSSD